MLLAVFMYMQEQQNCSHKTWRIRIEFVSNGCSRISSKDTHREKAPSNKTPVLSESMNMNIWVVGTLNQLFIKGSYAETKFSKKWSRYWQSCILCDRSILYSPFLFVLTLVSERSVLYGYVMFSIIVLLTTKLLSSFFKKMFSFFRKFVSKLKYWKHSKFPVIVT